MRAGSAPMLALGLVLIDPEAFVKNAARRFKTPGNVISLTRIEAFIIDATDVEKHGEVAVPRGERMIVNCGFNADERAERARFLIVLKDATHVNLVRAPASSGRLAGSYCNLSRAEFRRIRSIWESAAVAQRAAANSPANMTRPPRRLPKKLNIAAPIIAARKKSLRSAPQIVSGLFSERYTGWRVCAGILRF